MKKKIEYIRIKSLSDNVIEGAVDSLKELYPNFTHEIFKKYALKIVKNSHQFLYAAKDNEKIVGILTLTVYPTVGGFYKAWIEDFTVSGKYQGKGIGKGLLKYVMENSRQMKLPFLSLTSRSKRKAANHLYKSFGFKKVKTNVFKITLKKG